MTARKPPTKATQSQQDTAPKETPDEAQEVPQEWHENTDNTALDAGTEDEHAGEPVNVDEWGEVQE